MQIYPAIDLRGGQCVRLKQGDYAQETVFGADPAADSYLAITAGFHSRVHKQVDDLSFVWSEGVGREDLGLPLGDGCVQGNARREGGHDG